MSARFRRSLTLIAVVSWSIRSAFAQLPPPDLLLTPPRPALLMLGPVDVHGRALSSFVYDDNISLYEHRQTGGGIVTGRNRPPLGDDFIFTFAPGLQITKPGTLEDSRTALSLDYTPSFVFFVKNGGENSVDQNASLKAGYALTKLTVNLAQDWVSTRGSVVDVGSRVSQESYSTTLGVRYEMTEKTFFQMDGSYRTIDYETLTDSEEWSVLTTANYQIASKLSLGVGATVGQLIVGNQLRDRFTTTNRSGGAVVVHPAMKINPTTQTYAGPALRMTYRSTEKTDLALTFGGEWRNYEDGSSSFGPVFAMTGTYRPLETTSFSIEGHRREQNSVVLNGQNFIATGASLSLRQKLRERLSAHASFGYENLAYKAAGRGPGSTREDDYFLLRYGVDAILGQSWSIGIFHQYREDTSSEKSFSFENNQFGIQAAWGY